jgi:hypothetical protein
MILSLSLYYMLANLVKRLNLLTLDSLTSKLEK